MGIGLIFPGNLLPWEGRDHLKVWVGARDRARLEQLCRYVLRSPLAEDRLRFLADGRVRLELSAPGTTGPRTCSSSRWSFSRSWRP
jgi:hypothetical protein